MKRKITLAFSMLALAFSLQAQNLLVTPANFTVSGSGGKQFLSLATNEAWNVSITGTGFTASPWAGTGNAIITITSAPNLSTTNQIYGNAYVSIPGIISVVGIVQEVSDPVAPLVVTPSELNFAATSGSQALNFITSEAWSITSVAGFSASPTSGTGNTVVTVTAAPNYSTSNGISGGIIVTVSGVTSVVGITQNMSVVGPYFSVSPSSQYYDYTGGSQTLIVNSNLSWTVSSVTIPGFSVSPTSGTGNAVLTVTGSTNLNQSIEGYLILSAPGQPSVNILINQDGISTASLSISQNSILAGPNFYTTTIDVSSSPSNWSVTGIPTWIEVSPAISSGASFTLSVSPNFAETRSVGVSVTNGYQTQTLVITQSSIEITDPYLIFAAEGESQTINIITNASWTVASVSISGISVSPSSGTGNATITVTSLPNYSTQTITGLIGLNVGGSTEGSIYTTQGYRNLSLTGPSSPVSNIAGAVDINVFSNLNLWHTYHSGNGTLNVISGTGNATISYSYPANTTTGINIDSIYVFDDFGLSQVITIEQLGAPVSPVFLTVSGNNISIAPEGDVQLLQVYSNTDWIISTSGAWFSSSLLSGSGDALVSITGSENPDITSRSGTLYVIAGGAPIVTVYIYQDGSAPSLLSENGKTFFTTSPSLLWTTVPGANSYCIQIATDSLFTSPVVSVCNISGLQYQVPPGILSTAGGNFFRSETIDGKYFWRVAAVKNGVVGSYTPSQSFVISAVMAVNKALSGNEISIYPNPSNGAFNISGYWGTIQLLNLQGQVISEIVITSNSQAIVTDLSKGIYILKAGSTIRKLVIE